MRNPIVQGASAAAVLACWIVPAPAAGQAAVTYASDVAPLLNANCVACHRPQGIGPFSLTTYAEAQAHAGRIAEVVASRRMPPWKPVVGYGPGPFRGEPRLTAVDIERLRQWADSGAPLGDANAPPPPATVSEDWPLGEPDLVVSMAAPHTFAADAGLQYRNFVLPVDITERRWVRAVDIRSDAAGRAVIQRAQISLDATGAAGERDAEDDTPGYPGAVRDHGLFPAAHVLVWSAGGGAVAPPVEGMAWALIPGTDLILQLGVRATAQPVAVQASVALYFTDAAPVLDPIGIVLDSKSLDIPAGEPAYAVEDRYRLPVAVDLLGIYPYMHHLGRQVELTATLPDGAELGLLRIDDWDFDWQDDYRYAEPVHLPEGTSLRARFSFDNSAGNPRNPSTPPVRVRYGPSETDERAEIVLQVLPILAGDAVTLIDNLVLKRARNDMLGFQARLRTDPDDYRTHSDLGVRYLEVGETALAREHLEKATALAPDFPEGHFNLGALLIAEGDNAAAIESYRRTIALRPEYADAHNNVGALLAAAGNVTEAMVYYRLALQFAERDVGVRYNLATALIRLGNIEEAIEHFRAAATLSPDDAEIHNSLARTLAFSGEPGEAITHYERALELVPRLPLALIGLSWLRATAAEDALRRPSEALSLAQRAVAVAGDEHPEVLDALGAAYAATGRFDDAVSTARRAAAAARAIPRFEPMVPAIEARMRLYLTFRPYRSPPPDSP